MDSHRRVTGQQQEVSRDAALPEEQAARQVSK